MQGRCITADRCSSLLAGIIMSTQRVPIANGVRCIICKIENSRCTLNPHISHMNTLHRENRIAAEKTVHPHAVGITLHRTTHLKTATFPPSPTDKQDRDPSRNHIPFRLLRMKTRRATTNLRKATPNPGFHTTLALRAPPKPISQHSPAHATINDHTNPNPRHNQERIRSVQSQSLVGATFRVGGTHTAPRNRVFTSRE